MSNRYDQSNTETMEMVYGEGYLSAGGDREVARILDGVQVKDKRVVDVGCGLGGAVVTIARDHIAEHVRGVDVDAALLERAQKLVDKAGVADRVTLTRCDPGPLPLGDESFDIAYLNAVGCHISDLVPFFAEVCRVLRPGGVLLGNDWYKKSDNDAFRQWDDLLRARGLNFFFVDQQQFAAAITQSGFSSVTFVDRTDAMAEFSQQALRRVEGELHPHLQKLLGDDGYDAFLEWTRTRLTGLTEGGFAQGHFRAVKL